MDRALDVDPLNHWLIRDFEAAVPSSPPLPLIGPGLMSLLGVLGCGMVLAVSSSSLPAARWRALFSLSVAELLARSLWFNSDPAVSSRWRREQAGAGLPKWEGGVSYSSHPGDRNRGA